MSEYEIATPQSMAPGEAPRSPQEVRSGIAELIAATEPMPRSADQSSAVRHIESKWKRRAANTIAGIMTGAAIIDGPIAGTAGEIYAHDPQLLNEATIGYVTDHGPPAVAAATQQHVDQLLAAPTQPGLQRIMDEKEDTSSWQVGIKRFKRQYHQYCEEQAERNGLHLVDERPYVRQLKSAASPDEIREVLSNFTQNYGFNVVFDTDTDLKDIGFQVEPVDPSSIDLKKMKHGATHFMRAMYFLPKEVETFEQVSELRIVQNTGSRRSGSVGDFTPLAETNPVTGILYFPLQSFYAGDFETIMHELSHRLDYKMSGLWGMIHDRYFTALNDPDFKYGQPLQSSTADNVIEAYSATDAAEDKATLFQDMLNGLDPGIVDDSSEVIRAKCRLLLGRLEQYIDTDGKHDVVAYLTAISGRSASATSLVPILVSLN